MNVSLIPAELRERRQWVTWRFEERDGKQTKPPWRPDGSAYADAADPSTWGSFEQAFSTLSAGEVDGIGFVFSAEDDYCGLDLDHCRVGTALSADAGAILLKLDSYAEWSPSGEGVHVLMRACIPGPRRRKGTVEMYDSARFFAMTGEHIRGTPTTIEERQAELELIYGMVFPSPAHGGHVHVSTIDLEDEELIRRACSARNGADFEALWRGDLGGYGSHSEADLSLCGLLAFWAGSDPARIDSLFRRSGLMREKWDSRRGESSYGAQTVAKALEGRSDCYSPGLTRASESVESAPASREGMEGTDSTHPYRGGGGSQSTSVGREVTPESEDTESVAPFALALDEFIEQRSDSPPALLGDESEILLPASGLAIMFAKGGKGKTTAAVELALHLASAVAWLGFLVERPLRVLFLENEGPREPFRAKLALKRKLWEHEIGGAVFLHTFDWGAFSLADQAQAARLRAFVEQEAIDVVIGDPLDSLGLDGVGSPEDTRRFMALMNRAGLFRDVAFVLLHHPRKEGAQEELDEVSGAWGGRPDTMLRLERLEGDRARLSFPKIRWSRRGTRPAYILAFDPESESFSVAHEEQEEERDYGAEIGELLADGAWRTAREIAMPTKDGGIGANVDTVKKILEAHPHFVARTGDAAVEIGRSRQATVWQLDEEAEE